MKKTSSLLRILLIRTSAILCICFAGLTSVVEASLLDTPPPIANFFIPVNQRSVEPVRNAGDFIGRVFAPKPEDWQTRPEAQPITGVTVTIASGPRAGESVTTTPSGYYRFQNVIEDELHLRVEKEHFEPKEVRVHRSRPTILANGDAMNYTRDPQQQPGNILIGQRWPDEVRFILEETLVVHDLLYVEGGRPPTGMDLWAFYSRGVVVLYSYRFDDLHDIVGLLNAFAHEIAHAHQHATVSVDGSALGIHGWKDTPEGRAYEKARRKDWEQVGKSPLDKVFERDDAHGVPLTETAAEICAYYWGVDSWGTPINRFGSLEVEAPNRYRWAEKWVPINIAVRPPPKVVSILDQNLAIAIRKALGLGANVRITQQMMQHLTKLEAENSQIKNLTGLEHATRLRALSIGDNPISDFTPLKHLIQLKELSVWNSNFSNTMLLANMTQLTHLWLGGNKINDITPFANLTQLKVLFLPHNHIRDVSPLAGLANLETLHLQDNSIRDIRPLTELTKLTDLRLEINPITDKSPLRTLKNRNPNLKLPDIEISPLSPVVLVDEPNPLGVGPKIEGPWVWMIAPIDGNLGSRAASSGKDYLAAASGGSVTERHIATNGATPGVAVGNKVWTSGKLAPTGSNNIAEMVNTIGLGNGNYIEYHVAYGSLALNSPRKQNTKMYVGSDDAVKVWLNGVLIHNNPADRAARDYQDEFSVTLKQGRNILLIAVYNGELDWTGFFGFEKDAVYSFGPTSVVHVGPAERPPMYWIDTQIGTLYRLVGDKVENLASNVKNATRLAIDVTGGKLYWTERTSERTGRIRRANLNGNPNVQLVKNLTSVPYSIALDSANGKIYLTNSWGKIQRMNVDGSNFQPNLITGLDVPKSLTLDVSDGKVYWTEGIGRIRRANLDGSKVETVVAGSAIPMDIAVFGNTLYWAEKMDENRGEIRYVHLDGNPNVGIYTTFPQGFPVGIAVDAVERTLYWTTSLGAIGRSPLDGSTHRQNVVTGLGAPATLAVQVKASTLSVSESLLTDSQGNTFRPQVAGGEVTEPPELAADVNGDGMVNIQDLVLVASNFGKRGQNTADVNGDGVVNIADLVLVAGGLSTGAGAPSLVPGSLEILTAADVRAWLSQAHQFNHQRGISVLESLLAVLTPKATILLPNYPNPFNPETWIPYQLAKPADVSISIYATDGRLVRTLELGHQPVGIYESRSRATYWDGRNALGEPVASGVYFYTLSAGNFTATRKMLIRK